MNNTDHTLPADVVTLVSADGARALMHPHGAHVLSWIPAGGAEQLFLSQRAVLDGSLPIRGGVPVIFPQFAAEGPLPKHGFARTRRWSLLDQVTDDEGRGVARWQLLDDTATQASWPHRFRAELTVVIIGASLSVGLSVENTGDTAFAFTAALHTYLRVPDVESAAVQGLQHLRYRDTANGGIAQVEQPDSVRFAAEVDRIYFDAPSSLNLQCGDAVLLSQSTRFADVVVWNPGAARSAGFADLAPHEWREFVCIEPATIGTPVRLVPGERWEGGQTVTVRPPISN